MSLIALCFVHIYSSLFVSLLWILHVFGDICVEVWCVDNPRCEDIRHRVLCMVFGVDTCVPQRGLRSLRTLCFYASRIFMFAPTDQLIKSWRYAEPLVENIVARSLCSEPLWLVSGSRFTPIIPLEITVLEEEPQRCIYIQ